jgi:hypothetical protein
MFCLSGNGQRSSSDRMLMIWKLISLLQLLCNSAADFGDLFGTGMG